MRHANGAERPVAAVPRWILWLLAAALVAQLAGRSAQHPQLPSAADLPPAPNANALRAASLAEPAALARLAMVWLQAFDSRGDNVIPYQRLDYVRLIDWLRAILALDPRSDYPLFAAARVYAENPDPDKMRRVLDFIAAEFAADPDRRWPALAHAALLAKHRLNDLALARRYAAMLERLTSDESVPLWARQMEVFILEDMNELEAAKVMLGGLLATGRIRDPGERRFLEARLGELERRIAEAAKRGNR
ncbi:MAG: hypothetical protein HYS35_08230 [Betaproteobacteria bacterium]|nr:hypothetical protein [Betaproteobacteria bacterium]